MSMINNQTGSINPESNSTLLNEEGTVKVNQHHLEKTLSDVAKIIENKSAANQCSGYYQENSDGTFHSYSTEAANAEGINNVKIYVEAEYSADNIVGYTVKFTEFDAAGNILGNVESKLDADGTTIDHHKVDDGMLNDTVTDPLIGKEFSLVESIHSFPLGSVDIVTNDIMAVTTLAGAAFVGTIIAGVF
ncbi:hypothetical protein [Yersinia bercovieri]|uniref:hypothetical protein n=1 Tax=Yersinia bercovieri TaxID=634 RepID=UPI0011A4EA9E|nr:hypothetical protein [Yersinia bercovieri]